MGMEASSHPYATTAQPSRSPVPFLATALPNGLVHFAFCFAGWHWSVQVIPETMFFQLGFGTEGSFAVRAGVRQLLRDCALCGEGRERWAWMSDLSKASIFLVQLWTQSVIIPFPS